MKRISALNDALAERATLTMGTMWCVYVFTCMSVMPLLWPASANAVQYLSSAVIQLIALPLILVGQSVLSRSAEERAKADHEALMQLVSEIHALHMERADG